MPVLGGQQHGSNYSPQQSKAGVYRICGIVVFSPTMQNKTLASVLLQMLLMAATAAPILPAAAQITTGISSSISSGLSKSTTSNKPILHQSWVTEMSKHYHKQWNNFITTPFFLITSTHISLWQGTQLELLLIQNHLQIDWTVG